MTFLRAVFQGLQEYKKDAVGSILEKAILLIVLFALLQFSIDLKSFIIARVASVFLACSILLIMLIRLKAWRKPSFKTSKLKPVIVGGLPFALMAALYAVHERVDMVMVERLFSKEEAGLYSGSYHIIDFTMMYLWLILTSFFARFSFYDSKKAKQKLLNSGVVITSLPLLMVAGFSYFYAELPFLLFFKNSTPHQIAIIAVNFQILSISLIINGLFAILSTYLTSSGFIKIVNRYLIISIALNVVLNYIFIPQHGAIAAAWTTVISNAFVSISYILIMLKNGDISPPWIKWGKIAFVFGLYFGILFLGFEKIEWFYNVALASIITLISARLFKLLTPDYLKGL
jgi:O-antigen/teichoic acid export membrane protein